MKTDIPGPAFIPWNSDKIDWPAELLEAWRRNIAPYVWQDRTAYTMAGWIRIRPGSSWLNDQLDAAREEIVSWPAWKREQFKEEIIQR